MYTVKEVAKMLDLSTHAIRYYTDKGLVPSLKRDQNNNRLFNEESVNWLIGVKILKQCGMSIEDIKTYADLCIKGDSTIQERYEIILRHEELAILELQKAKNTVDYLKEKSNYYRKIIEGEISDSSNPAKWSLKYELNEVWDIINQDGKK